MASTHLTIPELTAEETARFKSKIAPPDENGCELWMGGRDKDGYGKFKMRRHTYRATRIAYVLYYGEQPGELLVCHNCPGGDNPACCTDEHLFLGTNQDNMTDGKMKGQFATGDRNSSRLYPERLVRGDDHPHHLHPERMARGDAHWSRIHPEWLARGEKNGRHTHPERTARGDNSGPRKHPERLARGEQNGQAKLTEDNVRQIRVFLAKGEEQTAVAKVFNVSKTLISAIWRGKLWRHIT